jgi:hypothetical protein
MMIIDTFVSDWKKTDLFVTRERMLDWRNYDIDYALPGI